MTNKRDRLHILHIQAILLRNILTCVHDVKLRYRFKRACNKKSDTLTSKTQSVLDQILLKCLGVFSVFFFLIHFQRKCTYNADDVIHLLSKINYRPLIPILFTYPHGNNWRRKRKQRLTLLVTRRMQNPSNHKLICICSTS